MIRRKIIITALAISAMIASTVSATAVDRPGLVPHSVWKSGQAVIKVGLIAPMTGVFATLGVNQRNSLQVLADSINAAGGIGGAKIQIVVRDGGLDPVASTNAAKEFAGDSSIAFVMGPSISSFYAGAAAYYEANKKLNCQAGVAALDFTDYKYGFRSQDFFKDDYAQELSILQRKGVKKFGMIYEAGSTGIAADAFFKDSAPDYGLTYLGWQVITSTQTTHDAELQKLINLGAQAVDISNNAYGAYTTQAAADLNFKGILFGGSGSQNIAFQETGGDHFVGTLMAAPNYQFPIRDKSTWMPGYKAHIDAVVKQYGVTTGPKSGSTSPNGTAIEADCLYAFAVASNKARSFDSTKVRDQMASLDIPAINTPSGVRIHPGTNHNFYSADGISVYQWFKDANGWYTVQVNGLAVLNAKCTIVGWLMHRSNGAPLICTKVGTNLYYKAQSA